MMICETVCEITNPEHYVFTLDGDLSQRSLRLKGTVTSDVFNREPHHAYRIGL